MARHLAAVVGLLLLLAGCGAAGPEERTGTEPTATSAIPSTTPTAPAATQVVAGSQPSDTTVPSSTPTPTPSATAVPSLPPPTSRPTRTPLPGVAPSGQVLATIEAIELEMETLRGLEGTSSMTRTLMTREELTRYLEHQFEEEYPPQEVDADTRVLIALNFVSAGIDLRQVLLDLYASQVLGMYEEEVDTLFIVTDGAFDLSDRLTLAHEFVHGLQDQVYGLDRFIDEDSLNDDQFLARMALVEGDATLAMTEYLLAHVDELSQADLLSLQEENEDGAEALAAAPTILQETLAFPYSYGTEFVTALQGRGWQAVDAAYADPPQSTEQILHPAKYLEGDAPQLVSLPPLTDTLGAGWSRIDEETLGEFQTRLYLAQEVDPAAAGEASAGWDGDRYVVYGRDGDDVLVLVSVWDSEADRQEFVAAYRQYVTGYYGLEPSRTEGSEIWWETPDEVTVLGWQADRTFIVVGPDVDTAGRVVAAVGP